MDEGDCNRSFPYGRCHALDIAAPDITDREDAGQTRLEEMRCSGERPFRGGQVVPRKVWSRFDEPVRVERDAALEPVRVRNGARHHEAVADVLRFDVPGAIVPPVNAIEVIAACTTHAFRPR